MKSTRFFIAVLLVLLAGVVEAVKTCGKACKFPAIYNFGDSNSDTRFGWRGWARVVGCGGAAAYHVGERVVS
ncbi:unnamed protein product [Rhodiola kirilowii]